MKWLMVTSRVNAQLFTIDELGKPKLIYRLENPWGRERNRGFRTDTPGWNRSRLKGTSPHAMEGKKNPHDEIADQFAGRIVKYIQQRWPNGSLKSDDLCLVADPKMLGKIRKRVKGKQLDLIHWIGKDLEKVPKKEWVKSLGLKIKRSQEAYVHRNRTLTS